MARIKLKRILSEDLPSQYSDLTDKLLLPINDAIDSLSNAMNNNLSVADNLSAQETVLDVSTLPTNASPLFFRSTLKGPCRGIVCIAAELIGQGTQPTGQPFFTFESAGANIKVTNITNLTAGSRYSLRIYCFT
jgi:hypothetical protein